MKQKRQNNEADKSQTWLCGVLLGKLFEFSVGWVSHLKMEMIMTLLNSWDGVKSK